MNNDAENSCYISVDVVFTDIALSLRNRGTHTQTGY